MTTNQEKQDENHHKMLTPNQQKFRRVIQKLAGDENGADLALYDWMETGHTKYPETLKEFHQQVLQYTNGDVWTWENIWSQLEYLPLTAQERELVGFGPEETPYPSGTPLASLGLGFLQEDTRHYKHGAVAPDGRRYQVCSGKLVGLWGPYREASDIELVLWDLREAALTTGDQHLADQLNELLKWRNPRTRLQPCGPLLEFECGVVPHLDEAAVRGFCALYDAEAEGREQWKKLAELREFYQ